MVIACKSWHCHIGSVLQNSSHLEVDKVSLEQKVCAQVKRINDTIWGPSAKHHPENSFGFA